MTNAKVKVSKEVAEAIEELYVEYGGKTPDRIEVITYDIIRVVEMRRVFGGMRLQDVIKAISDGYEVEKTPAEKVAFYYETERLLSRTTLGYERALSIATMRGIEFVVNVYGLKIEGVNA